MNSNPEIPRNSREELEARLTALLLGELPGEEAAGLREILARDAELERLHSRLEQTIGLVREAAKDDAAHTAGPQAAPRLSPERRARLLRHFRQAAAAEFRGGRRRGLPWFVPMSIAAALVVMIGFLSVLPAIWNRSQGWEGATLAGFAPAEASPEFALEDKPATDSKELSMESLFGIRVERLHEEDANAPTPAAISPEGGRVLSNGGVPGPAPATEPQRYFYRQESGLSARFGGVPETAGVEPAQAEAREEVKQLARLEQRSDRYAVTPSDEMPLLLGAEVIWDENASFGKEPMLRKAVPPTPPVPVPQPEVQTRANAVSTFSLNVSDVSFRLAAAALEKGSMPEPGTIRSEEFVNAFDYRDPAPVTGDAIALAWERARYPFAHNRDLLRFSVKTAAAGRVPGQPLNVVLVIDRSGSMERADRVRIVREALRVLGGQLQPQDRLSVITFARTARLWADGVAGSNAAEALERVSGIPPEGGTNLEEALDLAYERARQHYLSNGVNRVVLLTDGAANLGNVDAEALKKRVEAQRKQGIALDCFGIGWEGYNDDLLEALSRNGDGRYGFINSPEQAAADFAGQLAGAFRVAASDVKVQVEFNPRRVTAYRQVGYARHQLAREDFRNNQVDAAELGAAESGTALYVVEVDPRGEGPLGVVRVRFKVPGTSDYEEREWTVPDTGMARALEESSPAMRLAAVAGTFAEWLARSPYAGEATPDRLLALLSGVPEVYGPDLRPRRLEWMIRQANAAR